MRLYHRLSCLAGWVFNIQVLYKTQNVKARHTQFHNTFYVVPYSIRYVHHNSPIWIAQRPHYGAIYREKNIISNSMANLMCYAAK
jgi:hypothetical protein